MKNLNFRRAAQKTEGRAGRLHKKEVWRAAEKANPPAALFRSPAYCAAHQPALMCSPLSGPAVQPADPLFCAARQPAENSCFSFGNTAPSPPGPPFSVIRFTCVMCRVSSQYSWEVLGFNNQIVWNLIIMFYSASTSFVWMVFGSTLTLVTFISVAV